MSTAQGGKPGWTALQLNPLDNVATALRDLPAGAKPLIAGIDAPVLRDEVAQGHKLALTDIAAGDAVRKYGREIGYATTAISAGSHVHLHNLEGIAGRNMRRNRGLP
jgi:altronate dehydratase small subunit